MGRKSRDKGARGEREIVNRHRALDIPARRRQAPGLKDNADDPDVLVAGMLVAEVKRRASGFKRIRKWMEGHDLLFVREDNGDWLVVLPWDWYAAMLTCWYEHGAPTDFAPEHAVEEPWQTQENPDG